MFTELESRLIEEEYYKMKQLVHELNKANGLPTYDYISEYIGPLDQRNETGFGIRVLRQVRLED